MTRRELMQLAESRLGRPIPGHLIAYARKRGVITCKSATRLGWLDYTDKSVDQLVAYCQTRSRLFASQASGK